MATKKLRLINVSEIKLHGHVYRINEIREPKKILNKKLIGNRGIGRPKRKMEKTC